MTRQPFLGFNPVTCGEMSIAGSGYESRGGDLDLLTALNPPNDFGCVLAEFSESDRVDRVLDGAPFLPGWLLR